jgi:hypothetical protein
MTVSQRGSWIATSVPSGKRFGSVQDEVAREYRRATVGRSWHGARWGSNRPEMGSVTTL